MNFVSIFVLIISESFQQRDGYSNVLDLKDSHLIDHDGGNIGNDEESSHLVDHDNYGGKTDHDY